MTRPKNRWLKHRPEVHVFISPKIHLIIDQRAANPQQHLPLFAPRRRTCPKPCSSPAVVSEMGTVCGCQEQHDFLSPIFCTCQDAQSSVCFGSNASVSSTFGRAAWWVFRMGGPQFGSCRQACALIGDMSGPWGGLWFGFGYDSVMRRHEDDGKWKCLVHRYPKVKV